MIVDRLFVAIADSRRSLSYPFERLVELRKKHVALPVQSLPLEYVIALKSESAETS
jgi:hypothetical protein